MKKIFSNILLIFAWPVKLLKRLKVDNFLGGLFIGALFSLVVNVITTQIQEALDKQRTLEGIEQEIVSNMIKSNTSFEQNTKKIENKEILNVFDTTNSYSQDFWSQSSEAIRYVSQLDSNVQGAIFAHYSHVIKPANQLLNRADSLIEDLISYCYTSDYKLIKSREEDCKVKSFVILSLDNLASDIIYKDSTELLKKFHPTQDRLNNIFLKMFLGNKSVRVLSGQ